MKTGIWFMTEKVLNKHKVERMTLNMTMANTMI